MENNPPRVAVVILSWNGRSFLEQFLPSVLDSTYPNVEIWVADNHSTDGSAAYVRQHWPQVKLLELERNEGFAAGYNAALKQISAKYYVLLNQDVETTPGWIEPVIARLEHDSHIAAAQPRLRAQERKDEFEYAGGAGGFMDRWGYAFCRGRIFDVTEKDTGQYDETVEVFWATGAAMFVRAELFHRFGGFDGDLFAHMEEIDLCWRMKNAGYKIVCVSESVAYHVGGGSLPMGNPRKTFLNFRNNLVILLKNLPGAELWWRFPARLMLDQLAALRALFSANTADFRAIWRSQLQVLTRPVFWWRHRREARRVVEANRIGPRNGRGTFHGCIVWQFFGRGVRRFSDLPPGRLETDAAEHK